jgi:tRNA (adenine37-N6)-methyltransferase
VNAFTVTAIGRVQSSRTGRLDDDWGDVDSVIRLDESRFSPDALFGLDEFSHIEVIFLFDRFDEAEVHTGARRPRGNPEWPEVGIFAQRASSRPNRLGLTSCELLGVDGLAVRVRGLDAIDGTPVLDIKPYVREFAPRGDVRQPAWITELMAGYW